MGCNLKEIQNFLTDEEVRRQQFYQIIPDQQKAEFINGEIVIHSPAKLKHTNVVAHLFQIVAAHASKHKLGIVRSEKLMVSLTRNDYEPDIAYYRSAVACGFSPDQMKFPAPSFVVEVLSKSSEKVDRTIKFDDYAAHGVEEYWIIDADAEAVEQYTLEKNAYQLLLKSTDGTITSQAIDGLVIPIGAIFDEDEMLRNLTDIVKR